MSDDDSSGMPDWVRE